MSASCSNAPPILKLDTWPEWFSYIKLLAKRHAVWDLIDPAAVDPEVPRIEDENLIIPTIDDIEMLLYGTVLDKALIEQLDPGQEIMHTNTIQQELQRVTNERRTEGKRLRRIREAYSLVLEHMTQTTDVEYRLAFIKGATDADDVLDAQKYMKLAYQTFGIDERTMLAKLFRRANLHLGKLDEHDLDLNEWAAEWHIIAVNARQYQHEVLTGEGWLEHCLSVIQQRALSDWAAIQLRQLHQARTRDTPVKTLERTAMELINELRDTRTVSLFAIADLSSFAPARPKPMSESNFNKETKKSPLSDVAPQQAPPESPPRRPNHPLILHREQTKTPPLEQTAIELRHQMRAQSTTPQSTTPTVYTIPDQIYSAPTHTKSDRGWTPRSQKQRGCPCGRHHEFSWEECDRFKLAMTGSCKSTLELSWKDRRAIKDRVEQPEWASLKSKLIERRWINGHNTKSTK